MSNRRTIILVVSLVCAAFAVIFALSYTNNADKRAAKDYTLVTVYRADVPIPKGTPMSQLIDKKTPQISSLQVPQQAKPETAIDKPDAYAAKVATHDIAVGEILVSGAFADAVTENITSSRQITDPNLVAVTLSISSERAVAGVLQVGDYVNIAINQTLITPVAEAHALSGDPSGTEWVYLYQKAKILAIGSNFAAQAGAAATPAGTATVTNATSSLMTFEVAPEAALRLLQAQGSSSGLYLTLVRSDYAARPVTPINGLNLIPPNPVQDAGIPEAQASAQPAA